jgi:protein-tyrosine phosphatase
MIVLKKLAVLALPFLLSGTALAQPTPVAPVAPVAPAAPAGPERLVALEQGSNFRDIGGYATKDGRHVRWGVIYRSGATPLLTANDIARIKALGLSNLVDLRSDEERSLAPTKLDGIPYTAVGYSMQQMMSGGGFNIEGLYRKFPTFLAPQLKIIFRDLETPQSRIAYNCSAGQDRTGFVTAIILAALGVPRETIYSDYLLSTQYRHPEYELPTIDPQAAASNPIAAYFAKYQKDPHYLTPAPLYGADKKPYLAASFDEIDKRWGSVDNYLRDEVGLTAEDLAKLRRNDLE